MKIITKIFKISAIGLTAVVLVTVGLDAADHYSNFSQSIIGRLIFGQAPSPCPEDMVFVPKENGGFCIDKYEEAPSDNCPYDNPNSQVNTRDNLNTADCYPVSKPGRIPWRFISQSQAATACAKAGKRLPTYEEWYLASLGTPDPATGWGAKDCQVNNNWSQQPGPTGSGENCISAAGAYDMIGNAWEWVKGEINNGQLENLEMPPAGYIQAINSQGLVINTDVAKPNLNFNNDYFWIKNKGVRGIARGGYWHNGSDAGVYATYLVSPPNFAGTGIGFRCAK
jgi:formylglycine-generating enzyme required for sulfatase activity